MKLKTRERKLDVSRLFKMAGMNKQVVVKLDAHTNDNDLVSPSQIRKGWLYGAFLAFREYSKRHGTVDTFAIIGTGAGIDAIGAYEILQPGRIIATDIHPMVIPIAEQNITSNILNPERVRVLEGDLCKPLMELGIRADLSYDLIYANIPNIPNTPSQGTILEERRTASYFDPRDTSSCPATFQEYLLTLQYLFLKEAKDALKNNGAVIDAMGGRVPYDILLRLFTENGYDVEELVSIFKYQTEIEDVIPGYAKAERDGIQFDFYRYSEAQKIWRILEGARLCGPELKEALSKYRVSATDAWQLYTSGACRAFGIVAHYMCGRIKEKEETTREDPIELRTKTVANPRGKLHNSIVDCIGNTPLVRLTDPRFKCPVYLKLEMLNPGGSMKDRVALVMIEEAEKQGLLKPGSTIIEASSGNQGAAIAMIGASRGYRVIITASEKISEEKLKTLRAFGAEVRVYPSVPTLEDPRSYYMAAKKLAEEIPGAYWPNQYHNPLNPKAHYLLTGPELWEQTEGRLTHFFAAAGSTGTIMGVGRFLKEKNPNIKIIAVDAATSWFASTQLGCNEQKPYKTEGLGIDYMPAFLDRNLIDDFVTATDEQGFTNTRRLAKEQGILAGGSSGAVLHALFEYANKLEKEDFVVALLADSGRSYLSKIF